MLRLAFAIICFFAVNPARAGIASERVLAKNLVRVVSHDRNFERRFRGKVKIGVLMRVDDAASKTMGERMLKELRTVDPYVFGDHGLEVTALEVSASRGVHDAILSAGSRVVFVCVGLDQALPEIVALARKKELLTVGATADYVTKGLSFTIEQASGKPRIVINVDASRAEGTKFSAHILKLARVVE